MFYFLFYSTNSYYSLTVFKSYVPTHHTVITLLGFILDSLFLFAVNIHYCVLLMRLYCKTSTLLTLLTRIYNHIEPFYTVEVAHIM